MRRIPEAEALRFGLYVARAKLARAQIEQLQAEVLRLECAARTVLARQGLDPNKVIIETDGTPERPVGSVLDLQGSPLPDVTEQPAPS